MAAGLLLTMCEVLIRVRDKVNDDPYKDCRLLKRGDIVVIVPDSWAWSPEELRNPDWRILKLPNVALLAAQTFVAEEIDKSPVPRKLLRRRAYALNIESITLPALRAWIADDTRATPTWTINLTGAQLLALRITRPPLQDPSVVGGLH